MRVSSSKNNNVISSFYSNDQKRKAEIIKADGFIVRMYDDGILEETRYVTNHAINYVEDLAENFVEGIGIFDIDTFKKIA